MSNAITYFVSRAPTYMALLMRDFDISKLDAAAIMGNLGHESGGLTIYHEQDGNPNDNKGGVGWAQWTGPRRRAYEAYCARNGYNPRTDEANYKFLFVELKGSESGAISKLRAAMTLEAKVKAFEQAYERAGIKAYASRITWAQRALDAFNASGINPNPTPEPIPEPEPEPTPEPVPFPVPQMTLVTLREQIKSLVGAEKVTVSIDGEKVTIVVG